MPSRTQKPQSTYEECVASIGGAEFLAGQSVMFNYVLVAIYMRPERTTGGIILTDNTLEEDRWQGKAAFVLKKGPSAFVNDAENDFMGQNVEPGEVVLYRISDGFPVDINGVHCRLMRDADMKMKISAPGVIY